MGFFVVRTMTDGVLDTRGYRLRCFAENLLCAVAAPGLLALATLAVAGWVAALIVTVLALALALVVATSARTARGATTGGVVVAAVILLFFVVTDWFFNHPILPR
jgi:hypothetical protein